MKYDVDSIKHDLNYIYKYNFGLVERYLLYLEVKIGVICSHLSHRILPIYNKDGSY